MATAKTPVKKKVKPKAKPKAKKKVVRKTTKKVVAKKAAPKKRAGNTAANRNFGAAVSLATELIYEAGEKGSKQPTWGQALRAAYGSGSLSGTRRKRA